MASLVRLDSICRQELVVNHDMSQLTKSGWHMRETLASENKVREPHDGLVVAKEAQLNSNPWNLGRRDS